MQELRTSIPKVKRIPPSLPRMSELAWLARRGAQLHLLTMRADSRSAGTLRSQLCEPCNEPVWQMVKRLLRRHSMRRCRDASHRADLLPAHAPALQALAASDQSHFFLRVSLILQPLTERSPAS